MSNTTAPIFPQKAVLAVAALMVISVLMIGFTRLAGYEPDSSLPTTTSDAKRFIKAEDASEGRVIVSDAKTGEEITTFHHGEGSFFRAALRALVNNRKHLGRPVDGDFRLESYNGRQLFLIDDTTGIVLPLNAFGPANTAVFAAFMSNQKNKKGEGL
jgi:putative photosynthetic complex assembly protein